MIIKPPLIVPMGDIISSCVWDLDATIIDSYPGTGQSYKNIEPSPADGSAQSAYDFYLGATSSATTDDPTFTGTAGDAAAYFLYDGGDLHVISGGNTTFIEDWHDTTAAQDFTVIMALSYVTGTAQAIATTKITGANIGILMFTGAANTVSMTQRGGTAADTKTSTGTLPSGNCFVGFAHSHSGNSTKFWVNSTTAESVAQTFNATTAAANNALTLCGYNNATNQLVNTSRTYACAGFNAVLTDAEVAAVTGQWRARHNRVY